MQASRPPLVSQPTDCSAETGSVPKEEDGKRTMINPRAQRNVSLLPFSNDNNDKVRSTRIFNATRRLSTSQTQEHRFVLEVDESRSRLAIRLFTFRLSKVVQLVQRGRGGLPCPGEAYQGFLWLGLTVQHRVLQHPTWQLRSMERMTVLSGTAWSFPFHWPLTYGQTAHRSVHLLRIHSCGRRT